MTKPGLLRACTAGAAATSDAMLANLRFRFGGRCAEDRDAKGGC